MNDYGPNSLILILRWLGALPVALFAGWSAWIVMTVLSRISFGFMIIANDSFIARAYSATIAHAAMGAAFVYAGACTAPKRQLIVAVILTGLATVASGFLIFPALMLRDWWAACGGVFIAVGAGALLYGIHSKQVDLVSAV